MSDNIDKDFQTMLLPLNILQFIYCQPKFQSKTHGLKEKIHWLIGVLIIITSNVANVFFGSFIQGNKLSEWLFILSIIDATFYITSVILVTASNMRQTNKNMQLVIKMLKSYKVLKDKDGLKRFQKSNCIAIVIIWLSYFLYNVSYSVFNIFNVTHCVFNMILFYFDVNIIVAACVVRFLEYELILWKKELNQFVETCSQTNHQQLVKYLVGAGDEEKRLFVAYSDIVEAFKLCSGVFGMSILVMVIEGFGHPLIYIQFMTDIRKSSMEGSQYVSGLSLVVSCIWIMKTFTLLTFLCVVCQRFYLAVADVEASCSVIRGEDECLVYARRLSKNVQRYGACMGVRELRACNLVHIGASTPLHLLTLFGTGTVVVLQFAFL